MRTLLLRLAAPLQSWGAASKFDTRDTAREPTKSGVTGMLAAALGRRRTDNLDELQGIRFGVRIDQPGTLMRDFHTARLREQNAPFVTHRYYLADAVFLVGLEGEEKFLQELSAALHNPVYPLYLGRRSCPPAGRLVLGVRDLCLQQALEEEPWHASNWFQQKNRGQVKLTIVCDASPDESGAFLRRDLPVSFDQRHRQYGFRMVKDTAEAIAVRLPPTSIETETDHDPMAELGG